MLPVGRFRTQHEVDEMSHDDQGNTLSVELDAQVRLGRELRGLTNLELARTALGDRPAMHGSR